MSFELQAINTRCGAREQVGKLVHVSYAPLSNATVYTSNPNSCSSGNANLTDPTKTGCLVKGAWPVYALTVQRGDQLAGSTGSTITSYTYADGLVDRNGRGFVGFGSRTVSGPFPTSRLQTFQYNPGFSLTSLPYGGYTYPYAFRPTGIRVEAETMVAVSSINVPPDVLSAITSVPATSVSDTYGIEDAELPVFLCSLCDKSKKFFVVMPN